MNRNVGQLLRHAVVWRNDHRLNHKSNLFSCCFDCLWHNNNTLSRLTHNTFQVVQVLWFRLTSSSALGKNNCVFILLVFNVCILRWDKTWQEKQAEDESNPHTFHHQCHHPYAHSCYAIFRNGIREKRGKNPIFSKSSILPSVFALISAAFSLFFPAPLCSSTERRRPTKRFTEGSGGTALSGSLHQPATKLILNPGNGSVSASINKQSATWNLQLCSSWHVLYDTDPWPAPVRYVISIKP